MTYPPKPRPRPKPYDMYDHDPFFDDFDIGPAVEELPEDLRTDPEFLSLLHSPDEEDDDV